MFDTTASPNSRLGATGRPWFFFHFFIGEFFQLFHSNEAAVDLRSMAESPNCMTYVYVGFPLVHFSATCSYPHKHNFFYMGSGRLADTFWTGTKENQNFCRIILQ